MALPARGTLGQIVAYNGYNYKWTGTAWLNVGTATATTGNAATGNATSVSANGVSTGNSTSNTSISANGISTGNSTGGTSVGANGVATGNSTVNTSISANGLSTGNTTGKTSVGANGVNTGNSTVNTNISANGLSTGNSTGGTSVGANGISTGNSTSNTTIGANGLSTGNSTGGTSVSANGVSTGNSTTNTSVGANGVNTGNSTVNTSIGANGVSTGNSTTNTSVGANGVSTGNTTNKTNVGANGVSTGNSIVNTSVGASGLSTGNTTTKTNVTANGISTGNSAANVSINSTAVAIGTATINSSFFTGTANNALYLGDVAASNYAIKNQNQIISGIYTHTGVFNANVANFAGDVVISNNLTVTGSLTFSGAASVVDTQNISISNSIINIHSPAELAPLQSNDGRLLGLTFHYFDNADKHALLAINQSNAFLTYYKTSTDTIDPYVDPAGIQLGTIQADSFYAGNTITYSIVNATNYSGTANNALYLGGVAAQYYVNTSQLLANLNSYTESILVSAALYTEVAISVSGGGGGSGDAVQAYSNAIIYVDSKGFVNTSQLQAYVNTTQLSANLSNYPDVNFVLQVADLAAAVAFNNTVTYIANQPFVHFSDLANFATSLSVAAAYTNAISYVNSQQFVNSSILASYNYTTPVQLEANLANVPSVNYVLQAASAAADIAYANTIDYIENELNSGSATAAYANAVSYVEGRGFVGFNDLNLILNNYANVGTVATVSALAFNNAAAAYTNAITYVNSQQYVNTSILSSYNYITPVQLEANLANVPSVNYVLQAAATAADLAYANTIDYLENELNTGSATAAYTNAISYIEGRGYVGFDDLNLILNRYANLAYVATVNTNAFNNAAAAYTNAITYVNNQQYVNTSILSSYNYITPVQLEANLANVPSVNYVLQAASAAADLAYANTIDYLENNLNTGSATAAYTNAVSYVEGRGFVGFNDLNLILNRYANLAYVATVNTNAFNNAASAYTNAVAYVVAQQFVNTSILSSYNYTTPIQLEANLANVPSVNYVLQAAATAADLAYANAVVYVLSQTGGATSEAIIANSTAAYTNAVAYVNEQGFVTSTGLTNYTTRQYITDQGFTNTSQVVAIVQTNSVNTQQVSAIVESLGYVNQVELDAILNNYPDANYVITIAGELASFAYTNAVAFVNGKSYVNTAQLSANLSGYATLTNAASAYTNAVAYVDGKSYVNSSQLSANLDNYTTVSILPLITANAATAYTNAVAYVDGKSYVNTTNLTAALSSTINATANYTFTGVHTHNANLVINRTIIVNGDTGIAGQVLTSNGSSNVYWSTPSGGGSGGIFDGGTPFSTFADGPILDAGGVI